MLKSRHAEPAYGSSAGKVAKAVERNCPACGMAQPQIRARCYNCNASLEQAPVVSKEAPPADSAPAEKPKRRTDLWSDAYTPRPEMTPKLPPPDALKGGRAPEAAPASASAAADPSPEGGDSANPHTGRILRGSALAADAASFAPPPAKLRSRGSSGDPSSIAPKTQRLGPGEVPHTPGAAPRPGSGLTPQAMPRPTSGLTPQALPRPTSGLTPAAQPRPPRPSGERPALAPPPGDPPTRAITPPGGVPLERKRTGPVAVPSPADAAAPRTRPPTGQFPTRPEPEKRGGDTVVLRPGEGLTLDQVTAAITQANEAAKNRAKLTPSEIEAIARSYLEEQSAADPMAAPDAAAEPSGTPAITAGYSTPAPGGSAQHYLIAQVLGEPVMLSRDQPVRIGRAETNEIVFPLTQISRVHSEIRWDQATSGFVVVDRNSTNGTFVNGKPVKRRRLADGDKVSVGPFTIVYRSSNATLPPSQRSRPGEDTEVVKSGSLSGDLEEVPLPDVLRFIETLKKTGEVALLSGTGDRGTLYVRDGQPVHAEFKDLIGMPAAVAILRLRKGSFRFAAKPVQVERATVTTTLASLLKDAAAPA